MEVMHKWPHRASVPDVWLILLSVLRDPFFFMHAITGDTDGPVRIKIVLDMIPWSRSQSGLGFYLRMDGQKWTKNVQKQFCLKERLYQCYFMPYNPMVHCTSCVIILWLEIAFKAFELVNTSMAVLILSIFSEILPKEIWSNSSMSKRNTSCFI